MSEKKPYDPFKDRVYVNIALPKDVGELMTLAGLEDLTFFNKLVIDTIVKNEKSFLKQLNWELEGGLMDQAKYQELVKSFNELKAKGEL